MKKHDSDSKDENNNNQDSQEQIIDEKQDNESSFDIGDLSNMSQEDVIALFSEGQEYEITKEGETLTSNLPQYYPIQESKFTGFYIRPYEFEANGEKHEGLLFKDYKGKEWLLNRHKMLLDAIDKVKTKGIDLECALFLIVFDKIVPLKRANKKFAIYEISYKIVNRLKKE